MSGRGWLLESKKGVQKWKMQRTMVFLIFCI